VQLVDAVSRMQLWSDRYEGVVNEIFEFQDRIAAQVARSAQAGDPTRGDRGRAAQVTSLRAYDLVMRAFPMLWGHNATAINEAIPIPGDALRIDPRYGRAHALLAWCHAAQGYVSLGDRLAQGLRDTGLPEG
jgi:hypothetical protein